jgi:hypothetical protein
LRELTEEFRMLGEDGFGGAAGVFIRRVPGGVHAHKLGHLPLFLRGKLPDLLNNLGGVHQANIAYSEDTGKA